MEIKEKNSQLIEKMKGKQLLDILLYHIMCLALQSEMIEFHNQITRGDPHDQLSLRLKDKLKAIAENIPQPGYKIYL